MFKKKFNSKEKKRVFLITNHKAGDILEQELKKMKSISKVKIGSPDDINKMTERFLSSFNCIIYDL